MVGIGVLGSRAELATPVISGVGAAAVGDLVSLTIDNHDPLVTYEAWFDGVQVQVVGALIEFTVQNIYSEGIKSLVVSASRTGYGDVTAVHNIDVTPNEIVFTYAESSSGSAFSLMSPGQKTIDYGFQSFGISIPEGGPAFSAAGDKIFIGDYQTGHMHEGTMSTAWDLSTITYVGSSDTGIGADLLRDYVFNSAGTKLYVLGGSSLIHEISLSTPWDLSTMGTPVYLDTGKSRLVGVALDSMGDLWGLDYELKQLIRVPLAGVADISAVDVAGIEEYPIPDDIGHPLYIAAVFFSDLKTVFVGDYFGGLHEIRIPYHSEKFELVKSHEFPPLVVSGGIMLNSQDKFYFITPRDMKVQEYDLVVDLIVDNNGSPSWPYGRTGPGLKFVEYLETTASVTGASLEVTVEGPQTVSIADGSTTSVLDFTLPIPVDPGALVTDSGALAIVDSISVTEEQVNECTDPLRGFESGSGSGRNFERAFDSSNTDYAVDSFETADEYGAQIVGYAFPSPVVISRISVSSSNAAYPRGWVFEGSNDSTTGLDGTWAALHASSVYVPGDWADFETKIFDLANTTAYAMCRFNFTGWADFQADVINVQTDATLDPGATPADGDRYIITDAAALHANFGTITGLEPSDIVQFSSTAGAFEVALDVSAATLPYAYAQVTALGAHWEWNGTAWAAHTDSMSINVGEVQMMGPDIAYGHSVTLTQALPAVPGKAYLAARMYAGSDLVTGLVEVGVDSISDFTSGPPVSFKQISETANLSPTQKTIAGIKCLAGDSSFSEMTIHNYI